MLHTLFTQEHNHICDLLATSTRNGTTRSSSQGKADQLGVDGEDPYGRVDARHPAASDPPTAMNLNWSGLAGDDIQDALQFLNDKELLGGIVGSNADHHAAPYSLTEEFVSVYRMHPLMPDDFRFPLAGHWSAARETRRSTKCRASARRRSPSG